MKQACRTEILRRHTNPILKSVAITLWHSSGLHLIRLQSPSDQSTNVGSDNVTYDKAHHKTMSLP